MSLEIDSVTFKGSMPGRLADRNAAVNFGAHLASSFGGDMEIIRSDGPLVVRIAITGTFDLRTLEVRLNQALADVVRQYGGELFEA